ncbi:MAG: hypothetical protein LBU99_05035 [Spirochaetaceae bacterium]|jgi:hypothetical protein|nr:hypothetical protein [Spirochaetaceae bacterium]
MASSGKKLVMSLPLKLILTQDGASYFIRQNKKLLKFKLADNVEEYGISMDNFSPASIQRMILIDYISKIEISMPEFVSSRQEIMDMSKLTVFSMLYRQFDRQVFKEIISTEVVRKHNRINPSELLDERTKMSDAAIRSALLHKDALIADAQKQILKPVYERIAANDSLSPEEKNVMLLMAEKFITYLRPFCWYIILKFLRTEGIEEMFSLIRSSLLEFMEKSKVAEYIALMVMELAINSENTNLRKEARKMFKGVMDESSVVYDPEIRQKVIAELLRKNELVFISWKFGGGSTSIGAQGRLQITLYNKSDEFLEVKESIEAKKNANLKKKGLIDFYREMPDGEEGTDLGLFYLSYLNEACEKVNVKFESLVNNFSKSDLTVINLTFWF